MSIRRRTQEDVIEYIKNNAAQDGTLQQSLMDIAEELGYSNATIHRTLKSLEEQGVIAVQAPDKPTKPNTIIFNGPIETAEDMLAQGAELMNEVEKLAARVQEYVRESHRVIEKMKVHAGERQKSDIESRITEIVEMPDGQHLMMVVKKSSPEELNVLKSLVAENERQIHTQA